MRSHAATRLVPLVILLLALTAGVRAVEPVAIEEAFLHPAMPDYPIELNRDATGTLYLSDPGTNRLWLVEPPTGDYTVYLVDAPSDAKPDAQGQIWWTNGANLFGRLDPQTDTLTTWVVAPDGEANLWGLDFDAAGRVWLVEWYLGAVRSFDPTSNELCTYDWLGYTSSSYYLVYDQPYLWFINQFAGRIFRLDPSVSPAQLKWWDLAEVPGPWPPVGLAMDGAGGLWWADAGLQALAHLDPASDQATQYDLPHGTSPQAVYLLEGRVWYTESDAGTFGALDPVAASGATTSLDTDSVTVVPTCDTLAPTSTSSLTPQTGTLSWTANTMELLQDSDGWTVYSLPVDSAPYGLAESGGRWWLGDVGRGKLLRTAPVVQPDYTLDKTGDDYAKWDAEIEVGDVVSYTVTLENTGDATLVLSSFVDTLEPGVVVPDACATLSVDEVCSFEYGHTVTEAEGAEDSLTNTATAIYGLEPGYGLPDTVERSDSYTVTLLHPDYTLEKTGDAYAMEDTVNYTITLENTGDAELVLSSFEDTLEPGVVVPADCETLSVGEICSFGYSHNVTEAEGAEGSLANTATAVYGLAPAYNLPNTVERSDSHSALIGYQVFLPLLLRH
jgi:uncharacterized repeat protein (TIGR01451 family)